MFPVDVSEAARRVHEACRRRGVRVAVAESATGGLVAGALTSVPGASDVLAGGVVAYSDDAKRALLGVPADVLARHGAVSAEAARAMALGALRVTGAGASVATTGYADDAGGPDAGVLHVAAARPGEEPAAERHRFAGTRDEVRLLMTEAALALLARAVGRD